MLHKWPIVARLLGCVLAVGCLAWAAGPAAAQLGPDSLIPTPHLFTLNPPGGQAGTSVEVTFTGTDLEEPERLFFSNPAIKAEPVLPPTPPVDPKKKPAAPAPKPPITKFKVTIPAGTPVGTCDARLVGRWGVSNPRAFVVGDLPEVLEKDPNDDVEQAQRIPIGTTVNGTISSPTDVDYYVVAGKKGQRLLASCQSEAIDSRLQARVQIFDKAGRQLADTHRYHGANNALADATLTADGDYFIRVCEFTHQQGGPEYFYRLTVSAGPWIDAVFPPAVEPGKPAKVTVYGRNLPGGQLDPTAVAGTRVLEKVTVTVTPPADPAATQHLTFAGYVTPPMAGMDGFEYRIKGPGGTSNPFLMTYARAPVVLDNGANDTPDAAQEVPVPCDIAGRVEKKRDRDWYAFTAKKGEVYSIEVFGDRIGTATDFYFHLYNGTVKQELGEFDDNAETLSPIKFYTRSDDPPRYKFTVPADGKYLLQVSSRDAESRAGPQFLYRVSIAPEQPDFRLVAMPAPDSTPEAGRIGPGGHDNITVLVWRRDGWTGPVTLTAEGLPPGVICPPQILGAGLTQTQLVLTAAPGTKPAVAQIRVKGSATVNGGTVVHEARTASIVWPMQPGNNVPTVTRLDRGLWLAVRDQAPYALAMTAAKPTVIQGDKVDLALKLTRHWKEFNTPLQAVAIDLPPNLTVNNNQPVTINPGPGTATAPVQTNTSVIPGTYNIVLRTTAPIPFNKDPKAAKQPVNVVMPSAAVTLTVLPKQLATLTLGVPALTVKPGARAELPVRVARMFDFAGEFKVQVVMPPAVKGVSVAEATVPPGKDDAKLVVRVDPGAAPGNRADLVVRATALFDGKAPIVHEVKFSVNVVK